MRKAVCAVPVAVLMLVLPATGFAQRVAASNATAPVVTPTLMREPVSPVNVMLLPSAESAATHDRALAPNLAAPSRSSKAYMLAGAALFVAGLIIGGDAGTAVAIAGGGIGAYGVYLHFR